ncbi:GNAT family N-acetyltransferase [Candidatus Nitrosocosmicus arcticus]|uniref:N-acetyltransferase domain-containing protein n=1 Tax=Candidatus Nitrosocosmicus arcticus TaxID=2035267 RepID=A0A557SVN6_9ARCH|nr:GNAT family N-acetyltransferase [Candidatus Nitrosocosmicus arcticus]TVP40651.1 hypothetical protein NARC_60038 [Candidatus Nitrosocosmicus arcticus]
MDCSIIEKLKSNELEFCKNWSNNTIDLKNSFHVLSNRDLKGDYFLNRVILTNVIGVSNRNERKISSIISKLKEVSKQQVIDAYVHIDDNFSSFKSILEKNGLRGIDKLNGLVNVVKDQKPFPLNEFELQKPLSKRETYELVSFTDELDDWLNVYSSAFGINMEKRAPIRAILQKENFRDSKFILYKQKSDYTRTRQNLKPIGCCLLFPTNEALGVYCLGTDQRHRNKGIASSIIDYAINYAQINGFDLIGLQALHSDHKLGFYQRRHFKKVYTNAIYSLPCS